MSGFRQRTTAKYLNGNAIGEIVRFRFREDKQLPHRVVVGYLRKISINEKGVELQLEHVISLTTNDLCTFALTPDHEVDTASRFDIQSMTIKEIHRWSTL